MHKIHAPFTPSWIHAYDVVSTNRAIFFIFCFNYNFEFKNMLVSVQTPYGESVCEGRCEGRGWREGFVLDKFDSSEKRIDARSRSLAYHTYYTAGYTSDSRALSRHSLKRVGLWSRIPFNYILLPEYELPPEPMPTGDVNQPRTSLIRFVSLVFNGTLGAPRQGEAFAIYRCHKTMSRWTTFWSRQNPDVSGDRN